MLKKITKGAKEHNLKCFSRNSERETSCYNRSIWTGKSSLLLIQFMLRDKEDMESLSLRETILINENQSGFNQGLSPATSIEQKIP